MKTDLCQHIQNLKGQKIANYFLKAGSQCTGNKKHSDESMLDLCLNCGAIRCYNQNYKCSLTHFQGTKHNLYYRIDKKQLYCFTCKNDINSILQNAQQSSKRDKIIQTYQKIMKLSDKIGENAPKYQQQKKRPKKQKKQVQKHKNQKARDNQQQQIYQQNQNKQIKKLNIFGLKNLGNTCFFNSTMQCLFASSKLHQIYSNIKFDTDKQFGKTGQCNILFQKYLKTSDKVFIPKSFFNWVCKMKNVYKQMIQQDAQQLLGLILNGLIDGQRFWFQMKQQNRKKITPSQQLFGFFLSSRLQCFGCDKVSWSLDYSLQLPVQLSRPSKQQINLPTGPIPQKQIEELGLQYPQQSNQYTFLDVFFAPQTLGKKNSFKCQSCQSQKAWRKFYIKQAPQVLIISLKRFNNNLSKNNTQIKTLNKISLSHQCIDGDRAQYQLFGISQHSGTAKGGHYIAYTKRGQEWYYFSDCTVKQVSWEKVKSCQPYIMFYRKIK